MTWQQIYEEIRCHYKEGKKKERSYSLGRKEDLKKVQEIIDQPALWSFVVKKEGEFLSTFIKTRYCFSLFSHFQSFHYHSNMSSTASLSINSGFI